MTVAMMKEKNERSFIKLVEFLLTVIILIQG
jgi:hypothetical protein